MRTFIYFPRNCGTHTMARGHHKLGGLGTIRGGLTWGADPNDTLEVYRSGTARSEEVLRRGH